MGSAIVSMALLLVLLAFAVAALVLCFCVLGNVHNNNNLNSPQIQHLLTNICILCLLHPLTVLRIPASFCLTDESNKNPLTLIGCQMQRYVVLKKIAVDSLNITGYASRSVLRCNGIHESTGGSQVFDLLYCA
uniref:Uncharacterized protein n=1 Tax=Glossina palpalis gambiensis TaxID=67801 RepID=A0A1B0BAG9_9MUSC